MHWVLQLLQYNYHIQFRKSSEHGNADISPKLPMGEDRQFDKFNEQEDMADTYVAAVDKLFILNEPI